MSSINEGQSPERVPVEFSNRSSHSSGKMLLECCCRLVLQAPHLVMKGIQIDRRPIFHTEAHVRKCLKPNLAGSKSLIQGIFGLSDEDVRASLLPPFYSKGFCLIGSTCLCHCLVKLVKVLIRQAQCCKHSRLMHRHCFVSSLNQNAMENSNSVFEENDFKRRFSGKSHVVNERSTL